MRKSGSGNGKGRFDDSTSECETRGTRPADGCSRRSSGHRSSDTSSQLLTQSGHLLSGLAECQPPGRHAAIRELLSGASPIPQTRSKSPGAYSNQVKKSKGSASSLQWCSRLATAGRYSNPIPICFDCSSNTSRLVLSQSPPHLRLAN